MFGRIASPFTYVILSKWLLWTGVALLLITLGATTALIYRGGNSVASLSPSQETLATIWNSGSTNAPGWTLTVNKNGSGTITYNQTPRTGFGHYENRTFATGTFNSKQLETLLTQIGDVSTIPNRPCLKSASFGSTTTITYQGKTSGDLTCLSQEDAPQFQALKRLVQNFPANFA